MKFSVRAKFISIGLLIAIGFSVIRPSIARADDNGPLSNYWKSKISRWVDLIAANAVARGLDPNLVCSIMFEESKGDPNIVSPAGAVGLMQVMPFPWRPSAEALKDPAINLTAGTRTLSEVIRQSQGRLHIALMAYNSGWRKLSVPVARSFARKVLEQYASSILFDAGYDLKKVAGWTMILVSHSSAGPVQADRFRSDGRFEPIIDFDPSIAPEGTPHALAYATIDPNFIAWWVEVYVYPTLK
ncbi:MAG TPA: lytic transglycosylase domain-containing protein [Anaerolineae bacterium]|nr:lytic transglycosylase domain-containing protein [Anaerolineae bacterium]